MSTAIKFQDWDYEYLPYLMSEFADPSREKEIPNYRIFPTDDPENYIAETNEHLQGELGGTTCAADYSRAGSSGSAPILFQHHARLPVQRAQGLREARV